MRFGNTTQTHVACRDIRACSHNYMNVWTRTFPHVCLCIWNVPCTYRQAHMWTIHLLQIWRTTARAVPPRRSHIHTHTQSRIFDVCTGAHRWKTRFTQIRRMRLKRPFSRLFAVRYSRVINLDPMIAPRVSRSIVACAWHSTHTCAWCLYEHAHAFGGIYRCDVHNSMAEFIKRWALSPSCGLHVLRDVLWRACAVLWCLWLHSTKRLRNTGCKSNYVFSFVQLRYSTGIAGSNKTIIETIYTYR